MKKKQKPIIENIFEPVWRFNLLFIAGCSFERAKDELEKQVKPRLSLTIDGIGVCLTIDEKDFPKHVKGRVWLIWIKSKRDYYSVVHETAHLVTKVFEHKGMAINSETTEAFAFYQEFWCRKLWRIMSKK